MRQAIAATLMYTGVLWSVGANNIIALEIIMRNAVRMINNLISFIVVYNFRLFFTGLAYISR